MSAEMLSPESVMARWDNRVPERTLRRWRGIPGKGPPYIKLGHKVAYPLARLIEWENKQVKE